MKNITGRRIMNARKDAELSQTELAELMGVSLVTISRWERNTVEINKNIFEKLAKVLNKSVKYFTDDNPPHQIPDLPFETYPLSGENSVIIPVLDTLPGGLPVYAEKDVTGTMRLPRHLFPGADFAIRNNGQSNDPKIPEGSYCIIRKEAIPQDGRIMLIKSATGYEIKKISVKHSTAETVTIGEVLGIVNKF